MTTLMNLVRIEKYLQKNGKNVFGDDFEFNLDMNTEKLVENDYAGITYKGSSSFAKNLDIENLLKDLGYT